jgi:hypothetical protein
MQLMLMLHVTERAVHPKSRADPITTLISFEIRDIIRLKELHRVRKAQVKNGLTTTVQVSQVGLTGMFSVLAYST